MIQLKLTQNNVSIKNTGVWWLDTKWYSIQQGVDRDTPMQLFRNGPMSMTLICCLND